MKLLNYPYSQNDQNTPESKMTIIPFNHRNPLISTKIHTEAINHIEAQINTY